MMTGLFAFATVLALGYFIWNGLGVVFSRGKRRRKLGRAVIGLAATIVAGIIFSHFNDNEAREAGFESAKEMSEAKDAGIVDGAVWKERRDSIRAEVAAQAQRDAAEAKRQAEVAAQKAETERVQAEVRAAAEVQEKAAKAQAEDQKCREDLHCWGEKAWAVGSIYCREPIEKLAKWDFEWTDGWTEPKFSKYRWKDQKKGVVTIIGDKLKFQNGFGAWKRMTYSCDVEPTTNAVLSVQAF
jgi:hypothetical protein